MNTPSLRFAAAILMLSIPPRYVGAVQIRVGIGAKLALALEP